MSKQDSINIGPLWLFTTHLYSNTNTKLSNSRIIQILYNLFSYGHNFSLGKSPSRHIIDWFGHITANATSCQFFALIVTSLSDPNSMPSLVTAEDLHVHRDIDPRYTRLQQRLNDCWNPYMENNMSTTHFLKTVGSLYAIDNQWMRILRYWYYSA